MGIQPDWNEIFKGRKKAFNLPNILKLPTVVGRMDVLRSVVKKGDSVLDMGANDRTLKKFFEREDIKVEYFSLDIDTTLEHDYYSLDSVDRKFDVITAFELVEHISVADLLALLHKFTGLLKAGGRIVVSTPNVCHPVHFWRDCTHITPLRYDELYGLLASAGFEDIMIYRSGKLKLKEKVWALIYRPLIKLLKMDFMPSIIVVANLRRGR